MFTRTSHQRNPDAMGREKPGSRRWEVREVGAPRAKRKRSEGRTPEVQTPGIHKHMCQPHGIPHLCMNQCTNQESKAATLPKCGLPHARRAGGW